MDFEKKPIIELKQSETKQKLFEVILDVTNLLAIASNVTSLLISRADV